MASADAYLRTKWHLDPLKTVWPRKFGDVPILGSWVPIEHNVPGLRPTSIPSGIFVHPAVWSQQSSTENWGGLCPFEGGRAGSPSIKMWPGPRPNFVPSFINRLAQYTNVADRTDRNSIYIEPFYKPSSDKTNDNLYEKFCLFSSPFVPLLLSASDTKLSL